jgi:hypothetical protein
MELKFKQVGKNLIVELPEGRKTITLEKEERDALKEQILKYNALKSKETKVAQTLLKKITKNFFAVTEEVKEKEVKEKAVNKSIERNIKKVEKEESSLLTMVKNATPEEIEELRRLLLQAPSVSTKETIQKYTRKGEY